MTQKINNNNNKKTDWVLILWQCKVALTKMDFPGVIFATLVKITVRIFVEAGLTWPSQNMVTLLVVGMPPFAESRLKTRKGSLEHDEKAKGKGRLPCATKALGRHARLHFGANQRHELTQIKMAMGTWNPMGKNPIRSRIWVTFCIHGYVNEEKIVPIGYHGFGYRNH
jgi:hypothetical protein